MRNILCCLMIVLFPLTAHAVDRTEAQRYFDYGQIAYGILAAIGPFKRNSTLTPIFDVIFITLIIVGFSILGIVFRKKEIIKTIVAWFIIGVLLAVFGLVLVLGLSKLNLWVRTVPTIHFDWTWGYPRAETPLGLVLVLIGSGGFVSTVVVAIKRIVEEFRKQ